MTLRKLLRVALLFSAIGPLAHWSGFAAAKLTQVQQDAWAKRAEKSFMIANATDKNWTIRYSGLPSVLDKTAKLDKKGSKVKLLSFVPKNKSYEEDQAWAEGTPMVIKAHDLLVFNVSPPSKRLFDSQREAFVGQFRLEDPTKAFRDFLIKRSGGSKNSPKTPSFDFGRDEPSATFRGVLEMFPGVGKNSDFFTSGDCGFVIVGDKFN